VYRATVRHFSAINVDVLKNDQSCVRVLSPNLPASYKLEVTIPMGTGAAPKVISRLIDNSPPSEHVIYNLPSNVNIMLVPIRPTDNTPIGIFIVNTGQKQNPTSPNLPIGPPYNACATQVTLDDNAVPPVVGEFLHGLFSFTATNLTELDPNDPSQVTLKQALQEASTNYYKLIDPRGKRMTLAGFKATNGFPTGEIRAIYANSADLGFGRDMHCVRNGDDVAAYVTNYGDNTTPDLDDVNGAIAGTNPIATVAMEYSRIESPPGSPVEFDDPQRVVKFYVYNAAGDTVTSANLDDFGARPVPQLCMVCHGGEYPRPQVTPGVPPFSSRDDVKLGSFFIPFDMHGFTYSAQTPWDKNSQQPAFKRLNEEIVKDVPPNSAVAEIISRMYQGGPTQDENFAVAGWESEEAKKAMYRNVIARACRTCHATNYFPDRRFDEAGQVIDRLGQVENLVCAQHVMPHAKRTYDLFWTSIGPHMPAQLQAFGDTYKSGSNGWDGKLCGQFTAGGVTPPSQYTQTVQPIFDAECVACHITGNPPAGLNLQAAVSYGNIVNVPSTQLPSMLRIKPNDTANSYLIHKVEGSQGNVGGSGGRMPQGCSVNTCLSGAQINAIKAWVNAGAPP
jgi:mono/diheme cytochrome c family protein